MKKTLYFLLKFMVLNSQRLNSPDLLNFLQILHRWSCGKISQYVPAVNDVHHSARLNIFYGLHNFISFDIFTGLTKERKDLRP